MINFIIFCSIISAVFNKIVNKTEQYVSFLKLATPTSIENPINAEQFFSLIEKLQNLVSSYSLRFFNFFCLQKIYEKKVSFKLFNEQFF